MQSQAQALSGDGHKLLKALESVQHHQPVQSEDVLHISGVGGNLYFAYEQLRNAAEYSERHLLLRRAIERFLHRNLSLRNHQEPLARELVSELTHSRYLKNDSIPRVAVATIDSVIDRYVNLAMAVRTAHSVPGERLTDWIFQSASVEIEHHLVDHSETDAFIDFTFQHFRDHIDQSQFVDIDDATYDVALYFAVHRTLFKSDIATIRYYALTARLGHSHQDSLHYFVSLNELIDTLQQSPLTSRLSRLVNRYGAPLRILREVLLDANEPDKLIQKRDDLMGRVGDECQKQYRLLRKRLNDGIIRSVIFIFITKVLLGVSIEVPYDLVTAGAISWTPLLINTAFAPLYMATLGVSIRTPGKRNTEVIQLMLTRILYNGDDPDLNYRFRRRVTSKSLNATFNGVYTVGFLISFGLLVYVLSLLGFNAVQGAIFFVFLSVVSFFGFRLLQTSRELEIIDQKKSLFSVLTDFFYTPFIRVGNWLSDKYSRLNIVTFILDMAIELPMKSILRVIQQWVGFVRDKQEEL